MNDIELLQYVHETAEMGIEGLNSLDGQVRDDSLRRVLSQQGAEYRQIADQAERLLRSLGEEPRDPGLLAKVSAEVMSTFKTLGDGHPGEHHGRHQKHPAPGGLRRRKP